MLAKQAFEKAPVWCLVMSGLLLLSGLGCAAWLWLKVRQNSRLLDATRATLEKLYDEMPPNRGGLPGPVCDQLSDVFGKSASLNLAWVDFKKDLIRLRRDGGDHYFGIETSDRAFSLQTLTGREINLEFFRAVPGMLTGFGLLITFVAILLGLAPVHYDKSQVSGLEDLINNLSGKFVSSVAALFSASIFLFVEKPVLHSLEKSRLAMVAAIDKLIPRRTTAALLAEIERHLNEQELAFRSFNTGLSNILNKSFSESSRKALVRCRAG
ncbi:MAG: hypothetical protein ACLQU2_28525 [Candidatus Binataceae bacterium]